MGYEWTTPNTSKEKLDFLWEIPPNKEFRPAPRDSSNKYSLSKIVTVRDLIVHSEKPIKLFRRTENSFQGTLLVVQGAVYLRLDQENKVLKVPDSTRRQYGLNLRTCQRVRITLHQLFVRTYPYPRSEPDYYYDQSGKPHSTWEFLNPTVS